MGFLRSLFNKGEKNMGKFKIFNKTLKSEEISYGEDFNEVRGIFQMVGEDIELIEELEDDRKQETKLALNKPPFVEVATGSRPPEINPDQVHGSQPNHVEQPPRYFNLDGQDLMMKDGVLYHKVWTPVEDQSEYRVVSDNTGRRSNLSGKTIQVLDWTPVSTSTDGGVE